MPDISDIEASKRAPEVNAPFTGRTRVKNGLRRLLYPSAPGVAHRRMVTGLTLLLVACALTVVATPLLLVMYVGFPHALHVIGVVAGSLAVLDLAATIWYGAQAPSRG